MRSSDGHANCIVMFVAAVSSSEQINGPNYLVNLLKNLAAIAGTQAYQDMLKNANSAAITSNAGSYVANGFTIHEPTRPPIPVGTESSAGKTLDCLLLLRKTNKYDIFEIK